jgi:hypothetical protein|tara:strand:- start:338 stop:589 length:252 start_codon:yes stop_codon:yes gene_type:complete
MARDATMSMSVGGVKKITLYQKMKTTEGEIWAEHPNLPATFLDVYLKRGFVKNPPEPKKAESKTPEKSDVTITESPKIGDRRI